MMKYDFHIHSIFSDGSEQVDNIFHLAAEQGLTALALTDHDTILNIPSAIEASSKYHIPFIPAIELTAKVEGLKIHVLGYGIDYKNKELIEYSKKFLCAMDKKTKKQVKRFCKNNINISLEEVMKRGSGGPLYRGNHIMWKMILNIYLFRQFVI